MKLSGVIVSPQHELNRLDPTARDYLRWFLFDFMRGANEEHHRRWVRMWARIFNRPETLTLYPVTDRHGKFHKAHMALETRLFAHQDAFVALKPFREWLKTGACFGHWEASAGALVFVPASVSFEDCSDDEMREFHQDAIEFLRTPYALAILWPAMTPAQRAETLELLLATPHESEP